MSEFNVRVEYDSTPIRHIAVQCPECNNWFPGKDITHDKLSFDYNIAWANFECPVCGKVFGRRSLTGTSFGRQYFDIPIIRKCSGREVYDGVLRKKEVWE